jgi:aspartate kinase
MYTRHFASRLRQFRRGAGQPRKGRGWMARLVMKFGGTSVADIERIHNVARHVKREVDAGHEVAVVVSAMSGTTNRLVEWCRDAAMLHDAREYDTVVASGEQVTSGLLAIALQAIGVTARSWQGWQLPVATSDAHASARILDIDGGELIRRFKERKEVAVIAGFQGLHRDTGRITTLGRGGSDTSAVAVAAAIRADRCDIYTDVDGVYTTDPRVVARARRLDRIAFEEMLELASQGAKVLQVRSVELGMVHKVRIFVRSSFDRPEDIDPHGNPPGTLICDEEEIMEQQVVTGIAFSKDEAQISIRRVQDKPGVAASIFGPLADANINVDMIVQNVSADGATTDLTFTVPAADFERAKETIAGARATIGYERLDAATEVTKVSVIGVGMRSHAGVAAQAFKALAERGINIRAITTSEIKFSVLIDAAYTELAVRSLHSLYGLDKT